MKCSNDEKSYLKAPRCHIDNMAGPSLAHIGEDRLSDCDGPENVDLELTSQLFWRGLLDYPFMAIASVVDQHVDRTSLFLDPRNYRDNGRYVGDVENDAHRRSGSQRLKSSNILALTKVPTTRWPALMAAVAKPRPKPVLTPVIKDSFETGISFSQQLRLFTLSVSHEQFRCLSHRGVRRRKFRMSTG